MALQLVPLQDLLFYLSLSCLAFFRCRNYYARNIVCASWRSLFFTVAGTVGNFYNDKRIENARLISNQNDKELQQLEIKRMDKVMATSYIGGLTMFTSFILVGLVLVFSSQREIVKGIATGLLFMGTLGHTVEMYSMKRNNDHREK